MNNRIIKCSVRRCRNQKHQTTGIRYFRFPQNEGIRQKWIDLCQVSSDKFENRMYVCSIHFDGLCLTQSKGLLKLDLPILFLPTDKSKDEISAQPKISNIKPTTPALAVSDPLSNYIGNKIELDPLSDYCTCECEFDESANLPEKSKSTEEPAAINPYSNYCTCRCEIDENNSNSSESTQVVPTNSSILVTISPTPQTVATNTQTESPKRKGSLSSAGSPTNLTKISEGNVENTISAEKDAIETDNNDKVLNPRICEDEASLESSIFGNQNYLPHSSDYRPQSPPDPSALTDNSDDEFESYFIFTDKNIRPRNYKLNENGRYECLLCDKIVNLQAAIVKHCEIHEEKSKLCHICGKLVKLQLTAHIGICKNNVQSKGYRKLPLPDHICPHCDKVSQSIFHHRDHLNSHTGEKPYECVCGSRFTAAANFRAHRVKFGCPHPPRKIRESKRRTNVQSKTPKRTCKTSSDPNRYVCKECNLQCGTYDKYRFHIRTHITERNFICQLCNNSYRHKDVLNSHIRRKHLRKYKCTTCDRTFDTEGILRNHLLEHQTNNSFRCDLCKNEERFPTLLGLRIHQRDIHKGIKKERKSNKFVCILCEISFEDSRNFFLRHLRKNQLHIKTETEWKLKYNIKDYKCSFCSKLYDTFLDYSLHMGLTHTKHILTKMENCFEDFQSLKNVETFNNDIIMKDSNKSNNDKCILSENVTTETRSDHLKADKDDHL